MSSLDLEFLKKRKTTTVRLQWFKGDAAAHKVYKAYDNNQRHSQHCQHRFSLSFLCVLSVFLFSSSVKHILENKTKAKCHGGEGKPIQRQSVV